MVPDATQSFVVIDGDNLLVSARHLGNHVDFKALRDLLFQKFPTVVKISFYISKNLILDKKENYSLILQQNGYDLKIVDNSEAHSNIDIVMTTDILASSSDYNTLVLASGDIDFVPVLESLKKQGKRVVVVSIPIVTSLRLRNTADEYVNLEELFPQTTTMNKFPEQGRVAKSPPSLKEAQDFYFQKGIYFDSYLKIRNLLKSAKESVTIIDGYVDEEILYTLSLLSNEIKCFIITRKITGNDFEILVSRLKREGRMINIFTSNLFHDRFIRIDKDWWHLGHSIKDLGSADAVMMKVTEASIKEMLFKRESEIIGPKR